MRNIEDYYSIMVRKCQTNHRSLKDNFYEPQSNTNNKMYLFSASTSPIIRKPSSGTDRSEKVDKHATETKVLPKQKKRRKLKELSQEKSSTSK